MEGCRLLSMSTPVFLIFFLAIVTEIEPRRLESHPYGTLGSASNLTASISLGDIDNDGDLDAVVANGRHWAQQNFVYLNDGRGFFRAARRLGEDLDTSYRAAFADFDGDASIETLTTSSNSDSVVNLT